MYYVTKAIMEMLNYTKLPRPMSDLPAYGGTRPETRRGVLPVAPVIDVLGKFGVILPRFM